MKIPTGALLSGVHRPRNTLASAFFATDADDKIDDATVNAMLAVIDGAQPRNEMEAMLAAQLAVTHVLAMQMAGRLGRATNIPQRDSSGLALSRLSRAFTTQVEAFAKLRRGGEQKVTVEHVHVHSGGQAIVGHVTHPRGEASGGK